ncbi:MAG: UbiD family decarboxylase [Thermodesulfobacteriota bacterium]|nr:UbiD family decarboxylase [Thermodesulfobacteriota bacterium]
MIYHDLRGWIDRLRSEDEIKEVEVEVDWNREMGAISRRVTSTEGPALLFSNIKDYRKGDFQRLFTGGLGARRRVAMALDLPKDSSYQEIVKTIKERLRHPIKPVVLDTGPVKNNIVKGDEIDLYKIPVPQWHDLDGGRYIDTSCGIVTRDPDTGGLNIGTYRGMITSKDSIAKLLVATAHWGQHFAKYRERGEPMPIAICYGIEPQLLMCSTAALKHGPGISEYDFAGGLKRNAMELVMCESVDLLIPAGAEIVLEGHISTNPKDFTMEGPFGEYPGTYGGIQSPKPTVKVECMTYRNDPIYMGNLEGTSPGRWCESPYYVVPTYCALAWNALEDAGVPNVLDVWGDPVSSGPNNLRVRIKKIYRGHAKQVALALWGSNLSVYTAKNVIVVDEDMDVHNAEDIEWAFSYRTNAEMNDIQIFNTCPGSVLDPSVPLREREVMKYGQGKSARVLIDATVNWELDTEDQYGGKRFPPLCTVPETEDEEMVEKRWNEYGID